MKAAIAAIAAVLALTSLAGAAEPTRKYVVYVEKFQSTAEVRALRNCGLRNRAQPSENTQFIVVRNTQAVVLEVVIKDETEMAYFRDLEAQGKVFLFEVSGASATDRGIQIVRTFQRRIPIDLARDWSVQGSTP